MTALNSNLNTLRRGYAIMPYNQELAISEPLLKEGLISETDFLQTQRQVMI